MSQILSVLQTVGYLALAVLLLMLMITIHEFGHYITAKILKFKIYEFSIGMGKPIFKKVKKNGEIFAIRMIPVGGYCSFGEDDPKLPDTDPDSFNNKAPWKRLIVLFSGAFFNFVSAIIFAAILLTIVGYGRVIDTNTTYLNKDHETDPSQPERISIAEILDIGDKVTEIDGTPFHFTGGNYFIETVNGKEMNLLSYSWPTNILSGASKGDTVEFVVSWKDDNGLLQKKTVMLADINQRQWDVLCQTQPILAANDNTYHNFGGALLKSAPFSFEVGGMIFKILGQMVTGKLGMKAVGGTVATVSVMGSNIGAAMSYSVEMAFAQIFLLLTLVSINLALFNWLPIPSLDGARMVFVIIEWIRGKPINRELEAKIHMVGIICLLGFVVFADLFWIVNNLSLHFLL